MNFKFLPKSILKIKKPLAYVMGPVFIFLMGQLTAAGFSLLAAGLISESR
jgi:hypothetical protein